MDCQPQVAGNVRTGEWDYFTALKHGVFCELGNSCAAANICAPWKSILPEPLL